MPLNADIYSSFIDAYCISNDGTWCPMFWTHPYENIVAFWQQQKIVFKIALSQK